MTFLIKLLVKLLLLPVILVMKIAELLLYGAALLSAKVVGPAVAFLAICAIVSAFGCHWRDVCILAACCGSVWLLYMSAGFLIGMIRMAGDRMTEFLQA